MLKLFLSFISIFASISIYANCTTLAEAEKSCHKAITTGLLFPEEVLDVATIELGIRNVSHLIPAPQKMECIYTYELSLVDTQGKEVERQKIIGFLAIDKDSCQEFSNDSWSVVSKKINL